MLELVTDCPRCKANRITFNVFHGIPVEVHYNWQYWFEAFCICRSCRTSTVFVLSQKENSDSAELKKKGIVGLSGSANEYFEVRGHISLKDENGVVPPEHIPEPIRKAWSEGATCLAVGCFNASATMFRLCIDLATKGMLPEEDSEGLNRSTRRSLGLRLVWLFDNQILPESLRELSTCIKDDGNDGAHEGLLEKEDAEDVMDFTYELLERLYTEPKRLELAQLRRRERRNKPQA